MSYYSRSPKLNINDSDAFLRFCLVDTSLSGNDTGSGWLTSKYIFHYQFKYYNHNEKNTTTKYFSKCSMKNYLSLGMSQS